jgi:hypothetical protein
MLCAQPAEQFLLLGLADDVDQRHAVLGAQLDEHLTEIGCRGGVHQG